MAAARRTMKTILSRALILGFLCSAASCHFHFYGDGHPSGAGGTSLPTLLVGDEDRARLAARLGGAHLEDSNFAQALEGFIRNRRAEGAISYLMEWVEHVESTGSTDDAEYRWSPDYAFVCDLQWEVMNSVERAHARAALVAASEAVYREAAAETAWFYVDVNNWTISHMTDYVFQRMLYPALMFPDEPGSGERRDLALRLIRRWLDNCPGSIDGRPGEMIDETLNSPNGYGLWDLNGFGPIILVLERNTDFRPYQYAGSLFHSEAIYRTYVLSFWEGSSSNGTCFSKAGYVGAGHGSGGPLIYYTNADLLQLASAYQDPVLAYHYYANPSPCSRDGSYDDYLDHWSDAVPPEGWDNNFGHDALRYLLFWGAVEPESPDEAGWPLSRLFPAAGVAVMRKSWDKDDGLVWFRAGYGGSHYQPCQGTVIYHARDAATGRGAVILGNGGTQSYSPDSRMNSVLLVDYDESTNSGGQISPYPSLPAQRKPYGTMARIDDDTYLADLGAAYAESPAGVSWTRSVHYDRPTGILEIRDVASTADGLDHDLAFSWVTTADAGQDPVRLPAGYFMRIESASVLDKRAVRITPYRGDAAIDTLLVSANGGNVDVRWFIGNDPAALAAYVPRF